MANPPTRIGVVSDTHGKLDAEVLERFQGVDRIIHAGDIGTEDLLWQLEEIAPVIAVKGNNDPVAMVVPRERLAVFGNINFFVVHEFGVAEKLTEPQQKLIEKRLLDVVVFGHSHKSYSGKWRGTLLFNPGSAGPKRFDLPRSVGFIEIKDGELSSEIVELSDPPRWV